jgi:hypothetical protein
MTKRLSFLVALAALGQPAVADDRWVKVTLPVLACEAGLEDRLLKAEFLRFLEAMPIASTLPEECRRMLEVGQTYLLDPEQTEEEAQELVQLWKASCANGRVRLVAALYAPPRRLMGAYLRPARAPDGCEKADAPAEDN